MITVILMPGRMKTLGFCFTPATNWGDQGNGSTESRHEKPPVPSERHSHHTVFAFVRVLAFACVAMVLPMLHVIINT
jgi:hypothetical protein